MAKPTLKTIGLSKTFETNGNKVQALSRVNLEVMRGDFLAIMGPSGSGKTTLLTLMGCLDKPTTGRILLGSTGLNVTTIPEAALYKIRRKNLGFIFQNFNLLPSLTALENVELPMEGLIKSAKRRRKRARALLRMLEMSHREKHKPPQLSAGEQQRVAIARALANGPALILADEPTGNLVTHDPHMASFASRKLFIRDGKLLKEDPIYEEARRFSP